jgi:hypothetical protein
MSPITSQAAALPANVLMPSMVCRKRSLFMEPGLFGRRMIRTRSSASADLKSGAAFGRAHVVNSQAMAGRRYKTPPGIAIPDGVCSPIL